MRSFGGDLILAETMATGAVRLVTGSPDTQKMMIASNGNVGIGTTAPAAKVDVAGGAIFRKVISANAPSSARYCGSCPDALLTLSASGGTSAGQGSGRQDGPHLQRWR